MQFNHTHIASGYMNVVQQQMKSKNEKSNKNNWFSPKNYGKRLYDNMLFGYIFDSFIAVTGSFSDKANNFLSTGVPSLIGGIFGILPAIIPFIPNMLCYSKKNKDTEKVEENVFSEYEIKLNKEFEPFFNFADTLYPSQQDLLISLIQANKAMRLEEKKEVQFSFIDNLMNVIYLEIRGATSMGVIIKFFNVLSEEQSSKIDDVCYWLNVTSSLAYLMYYLSSVVPEKYSLCNLFNGKKGANQGLVVNGEVAARPSFGRGSPTFFSGAVDLRPTKYDFLDTPLLAVSL